jgi:catechol 2,3-dioxygenase-like lactoylglutathione lyase family enzyme
VKVKQLAHVVLRIPDLERSKRWYVDVMGLKIMTEFPGRMAFLSASDSGSHELGLMQNAPDAPGLSKAELACITWAGNSIRSRNWST